jgi:nucleotide-binding universal stress UspA family protein
VVVAFDGSDESQAAVRAAATLFGERPLVVVAVWEPGLATMAFTPAPGDIAMSYPPPDPADVAAVDQAERTRAGSLADAGARIARELGATAEALPVPDEVDVAETIAAIAEQRDAGAIVVGSRGRSGFKRRVLGSTSQGVMHHTRRPVLVVRGPEGDGSSG